MAAKPKPAPVTITPAEIDEFAMLHEQLGPMRKRHDQLQAKLVASKPTLANNPTATADFEGANYYVAVSERTNETKVTGLDRLYKLLGVGKFLAFVKRCQVTQKALDASLPAGADRRAFLVIEQTGHRNYSITRKFTGKAA